MNRDNEKIKTNAEEQTSAILLSPVGADASQDKSKNSVQPAGDFILKENVMENEKKWYVEYSLMQKCFHLDSMDKIQKINLSLQKRGVVNGYAVIGGPFTSEEARNFIDQNHSLKDVKKYDI